jgi:hypothetical protein
VTQRTKPITPSKTSRRDVARVWETIEDVVSQGALIGILAVSFAYAYHHTVKLFAYYGVDVTTAYWLAATAEAMFFAFFAEYRRRAKANLGVSLPVTGMTIGVGISLWANLAGKAGGLGGLIVAGFAPACSVLCLLTFETRRRAAKKAAPKPAKSTKTEARVPVASAAEIAQETVTDDSIAPREAAARAAEAHFATHGEWPELKVLKAAGHADGTARRGIELARERAGQPQLRIAR